MPLISLQALLEERNQVLFELGALTWDSEQIYIRLSSVRERITSLNKQIADAQIPDAAVKESK